MTATQTIRPLGIPSAEAFGTTPITQASPAAIVATVANADAALQRRMTREGYVLGYFGVGAGAGQLVDGPRGFVVGGLSAAALAYYRSRSTSG